MSIINKIGLEAEFLVRNEKDELVYPSSAGLGSDDFPLIAEIRGEPGDTVAKSIANFMLAYWGAVQSVKRMKLKIDLNGFAKISPELHAEAMRKAGTKNVAKCANIYGTDILSMSDAEVDKGAIKAQLISCGLHVHFSSEEVVEVAHGPTYEEVKLPVKIAGTTANIDLFRKTADSAKKITARAGRITAPVIKHIVEGMDKDILPKMMDKMQMTKYRHPGFYEKKSHGFEYRSLPFNKTVMDALDDITSAAFGYLEAL